MLVVENLPYRTRDQDRPKVIQYLEENPDEEVRVRPDVELDNAWETGRVYAIKQGEDVVGISLMYAFEHANIVSFEIGTVHVHEKARGLGLQEFVNALQIYQTCAIEEGDWEAFDLFAVASMGKASYHVLANKLGMSDRQPPGTLAQARAGRGLPFSDAKAVLFCDRPAVTKAADLLRSCHIDGSRFSTPKNGQIIEIAASWFEAAMLEVWR